MSMQPPPLPETHEVLNQPPPLVDYNLYEQDAALKEGVQREGGAWAEDRIAAFGALMGRPETIELGHLANKHTPELRLFDRFGHRIDEVEFHPAWHELMRIGKEHGVHGLPWSEPRPGAHVARAALFNLLNQVENGVCCPLTMTFASVPALRHQPDVAEEWVPRVTANAYDPRPVPVTEKPGATMGMFMTEKQGGSDVRSNTTRAYPVGKGGPGQEYRLVGHKWFCSAPMCDAFLSLAYTADNDALSCFIVPRWTPDGERNRLQLQRLKDKMGNRSNASGEIEYRNAWARMVGQEGRGVRTIIEMVHHTRLDCVLGSAGISRQAVAQALHHTHYRAAFDRPLDRQPLMKNVLADLAIESEAITALALRLARSYDDVTAGDEAAVLFSRIATAIGKYWICKRTPAVTVEAMECHGGNGYVEESITARLAREAPCNSIWEGSGNVMCLDVLRAAVKTPETVPAYVAEIERAKGGDRRLDAYVEKLKAELANTDELEARARRLVEKLAVGLQAALLVQHSPPAVADAFCASRLDGDGGLNFGTLPASVDFSAIIERARPQCN